MKITLRNSFHSTAVTVIPGPGCRLNHNQVLRVRRELCGIAGCTCGTVRGGRYYWDCYQTSSGGMEAEIRDRY